LFYVKSVPAAKAFPALVDHQDGLWRHAEVRYSYHIGPIRPARRRFYYFVVMVSFVRLNPRYVNMPDINFKSLPSRSLEAEAGAGAGALSPVAAGPLRWDIIELLFFAYRDFVGDPDAVLDAFGFGRAHHRVVHFVHRYPGLKVADLLDVLRITKQSLGRVLKQLLDEGYIVQREGAVDRRQRLLFATAKGDALVAQLAGLQTDRITRALQGFDANEVDAIKRFLSGMIDRDDPDKVLQEILGDDPGANRGMIRE
jgi:DNA-binding MarR family transcriptional regulator